MVNGKPLVYFYNSGRLSPNDKGAAVVEEIKNMFKQDFGVRPFVVQDQGFAPDSNTDITFQWDPLGNIDRISKSEGAQGFKLLHVLPKFDAMGRSHPGALAGAFENAPDNDYRVIKDFTLLRSALANANGYDLMSIGTWNDLGEGTGVGRNYDYAIKGNIVTPLYFMNIMRKIQCT